MRRFTGDYGMRFDLVLEMNGRGRQVSVLL